MSIDRELLEKFFNDEFTKNFFRKRDYQTRVNVSIISSICDNIKNTPENERTNEFLLNSADEIIKQCHQMMKMSDIYVNLSKVYDDMEYNTHVIDINSLLNEFSKECNSSLEKELLQRISGKTVCIDVCEDVLVCLMLLYIRRAVTDGAEKIILSHNSGDEYADIVFGITERGRRKTRELAENVSVEYAFDIIEIFADRLDCTSEISENGLRLRFKIANDGKLKFESSKTPYGKKRFSLYSNILSDLGHL